VTTCLPWILRELTWGLRGDKLRGLESGAVQVSVIAIVEQEQWVDFVNISDVTVEAHLRAVLLVGSVWVRAV
jgi:hypothetical protein